MQPVFIIDYLRMIKIKGRFLLPLCILLLSIYSQVFAHTLEKRAFFSQTENLRASEHAAPGTLQAEQAFITKPSSTGTERKQVAEAACIEIEEDESLSSRKHAGVNYYITSIFCAQVLEFFLRSNLNKGFSFSKHFSIISSCRWHLVIQVFRI